MTGAIELLQLLRQPGALAPQLLRTLGIAPDVGRLELERDFLQAFFLAVVFKGTP